MRITEWYLFNIFNWFIKEVIHVQMNTENSKYSLKTKYYIISYVLFLIESKRHFITNE